METCVIYARFSSYGQNEQSIEAQVRICKETAESKGLKVINIYPDKARTGTNDSRPAFQRMIADAASGAFQYIIVYMFDRFARNRRDSIMYKEMLELERGYKISRKDMIDFIQVLIDGDVYDKEYQRKIIDNLVFKVYVSDGDTLTLLTINDGKHPEEIPFETVKEILENYRKECDSVQTRLPLARQ